MNKNVQNQRHLVYLTNTLLMQKGELC